MIYYTESIGLTFLFVCSFKQQEKGRVWLTAKEWWNIPQIILMIFFDKNVLSLNKFPRGYLANQNIR